MLRTVVIAGLAGLVIAVDWLRFEEPRSGGGRPFVLVLLAIAPVLLRPLRFRLIALPVAWLFAIWIAFSISPKALWPGGESYFGTLGSRFGGGGGFGCGHDGLFPECGGGGALQRTAAGVVRAASIAAIVVAG